MEKTEGEVVVSSRWILPPSSRTQVVPDFHFRATTGCFFTQVFRPGSHTR